MRHFLLPSLVLSACVVLAGCSTSGDTETGSGGNSGSGGSASGSGGNASGGTTGTGGAVATGGTTGSGGLVGSGGGGGVGTGGSIGSGGRGLGGSVGSGGRGLGGSVGSGGVTTGSGGRGGSGNTGGAATGGTRAAGGSGGAGDTGGATACIPGAAWTGGKTYSGDSQGNVGNGYSYQLWRSGSSGSMTVAGVDAKFSASWSNSGDFLARVGLGWNSSQTYDQLGTLEADYAYTKTGSGGGYSYIGIYGWSESPLHEFYIVDDWFGTGAPNPGTKVGTFTVDGGTYNVYTHTQNNQPAITGGNQTFVQFLSVRQTARQCGHISISEHFKEWASLGLTLGKMEEARLLVEAGGGTGTINYTTATLTATK